LKHQDHLKRIETIKVGLALLMTSKHIKPTKPEHS